MNDLIARRMIDKMVTDTKPNYASLKAREEALLAQLKELQEEIKIAENNIIEEKLSTALQLLAEVDEMTNGYYRCTLETYCEGCEEDIDIDVDLAEIISAIQSLR